MGESGDGNREQEKGREGVSREKQAKPKDAFNGADFRLLFEGERSRRRRWVESFLNSFAHYVAYNRKKYYSYPPVMEALHLEVSGLH